MGEEMYSVFFQTNKITRLGIALMIYNIIIVISDY
jgi:hypothetical protein